MTTLSDFFSKEEIYEIRDSSSNKIGLDIVTYQFTKLQDPKNLKSSNCYAVSVKHRVVVSGSKWNPGGKYQANGFNNYPILLSVKSGIKNLSSSDATITLNKVFPRTINASVELNTNHSTGTSSSQTNQTTSGSSTSNVNTFGVSLSAGFFGEMPVGSLGLDYSHSWQHTNSDSQSTGQGTSDNSQAVSGEDMSVKDWSAYASILNIDEKNDTFTGKVVQWDWGQSYPWNIFKYNTKASGDTIGLPADVQARILYSGATNVKSSLTEYILLPPSDLSLFGLDFSMKAEWRIVFPANIESVETIMFEHTVDVIHASHSKISGKSGSYELNASLTPGYPNKFTQSENVDMGKYALVPFIEPNRNGAGIGFREHLFDIAPTSANSVFKILSAGNNLLVTGTGFESVMSAVFPKLYSGSGATLKVSFKIVDLQTEYALILHHWKGADSGNLKLSCCVNGDWTTEFTLDAEEGRGASNNISKVDLRNLDLKSANFHDYLVVGLNEIEITITPSSTSTPSEYVISALAVER